MRQYRQAMLGRKNDNFGNVTWQIAEDDMSSAIYEIRKCFAKKTDLWQGHKMDNE